MSVRVDRHWWWVLAVELYCRTLATLGFQVNLRRSQTSERTVQRIPLTRAWYGQNIRLYGIESLESKAEHGEATNLTERKSPEDSEGVNERCVSERGAKAELKADKRSIAEPIPVHRSPRLVPLIRVTITTGSISLTAALRATKWVAVPQCRDEHTRQDR